MTDALEAKYLASLIENAKLKEALEDIANILQRTH